MALHYPRRIQLANLPTPLQYLKRASKEWGRGHRLWVKRDDLTGSTLTGNKVRKLEFIAAHALDQGHKAHLPQFLVVEAVIVATDLNQHLHRIRLTHGQHHDSTGFQLGQKGAGGVFRRRRHHDPVKGRLLGQAARAV